MYNFAASLRLRYSKQGPRRTGPMRIMQKLHTPTHKNCLKAKTPDKISRPSRACNYASLHYQCTHWAILVLSNCTRIVHQSSDDRKKCKREMLNISWWVLKYFEVSFGQLYELNTLDIDHHVNWTHWTIDTENWTHRNWSLDALL